MQVRLPLNHIQQLNTRAFFSISLYSILLLTLTYAVNSAAQTNSHDHKGHALHHTKGHQQPVEQAVVTPAPAVKNKIHKVKKLGHDHHQAHSKHKEHGHHNMTLSTSGMVMNSNTDQLPKDCKKIARDITFTVYAGREYASQFPGAVYGMSSHEYRVDPCSRVTIHFINKDKVRHQWMIHGLPKYLYPAGMFHLEAAGEHELSGSFIVPSDSKTYLVHCDLAQHMEKGMKGQLVVGSGSGNLWSIPGISDVFIRDNYLPTYSLAFFLATIIVGILFAWFMLRTYPPSRNS